MENIKEFSYMSSMDLKTCEKLTLGGKIKRRKIHGWPTWLCALVLMAILVGRLNSRARDLLRDFTCKSFLHFHNSGLTLQGFRF